VGEWGELILDDGKKAQKSWVFASFSGGGVEQIDACQAQKLLPETAEFRGPA